MRERLYTICALTLACSAAPASRSPAPSGSVEQPQTLPELDLLRKLWPHALANVMTTDPPLDLSAWQATSEAAVVLPGVTECQTLVRSAQGFRFVTFVEEREGRRYRSIASCALSPDLKIDYGHLETEVQVDGAWQPFGPGVAVTLPQKSYGVLTEVTPERLVYGGERVVPVEGCTGDLLGCSGETLPPWRECRACDKTELFFVPRPAEDPPPLDRLPECLFECPSPPHRKQVRELSDLRLWRQRDKSAPVAIVFRDVTSCRRYLASIP